MDLIGEGGASIGEISEIGVSGTSTGESEAVFSDGKSFERGISDGLNRSGSEVVMGPEPRTIQSRLYSGKVSFIFLTRSRLGWFRPERIWEMAEG